MKIGRFTYLLTFLSLSLWAQQDPQYSQYQYNTMVINPAYTGSRGHLVAISLYRDQWVGIDGSPRTITVGLDTPLGIFDGLGISLVQDDLGPSSETFIDANYSHTLFLNGREDRLALGIKGGVRFFSLDWSRGLFRDQEAVFNENVSGKLLPTVGAGVFFYNRRSYLGLSTPNVLPSTIYDDINEIEANEEIHLYLIGGYVFDLNPFLKFKPTFFAKHVDGSPLSLDISANFLMDEKLTLGVNYRWGDSFGGLIGFQINDQFNIGYGYDLTTTDLGAYNSGTHEIFIRCRSRAFRRKQKSPRFF